MLGDPPPSPSVLSMPPPIQLSSTSPSSLPDAAGDAARSPVVAIGAVETAATSIVIDVVINVARRDRVRSLMLQPSPLPPLSSRPTSSVNLPPQEEAITAALSCALPTKAAAIQHGNGETAHPNSPHRGIVPPSTPSPSSLPKPTQPNQEAQTAWESGGGKLPLYGECQRARGFTRK